MDRNAEEQQAITLNTLRSKAQKFEKAHKSCREINQQFHSILGILILTSSASVTCLESIIDLTNHVRVIGMIRIILASVVTALVATQNFFENNTKAERHHSVSRQYSSLVIEIDKLKVAGDGNVIQILDKFNDIRSTSVSLFPRVRRSLHIDD